MSRRSPARTVLPLLAAAVVLSIAVLPGSAAKPAPAVPGVAVFANSVDNPNGDAITGDGGSPYLGTFNTSGDFTFSTGTQREVAFSFAILLGLVDGQTAPPGATLPASGPQANVTFAVLANNTDSMLRMAAGASTSRAARFDFPNAAGTSPSSYGVHFRGDAVVGGTTEMSRVLVTCDAADGSGCTRWTLTPCAGQCSVGNPDQNGVGRPVAQVYGSFGKRIGNAPIDRVEMAWTMTVCRGTSC